MSFWRTIFSVFAIQAILAQNLHARPDLYRLSDAQGLTTGEEAAEYRHRCLLTTEDGEKIKIEYGSDGLQVLPLDKDCRKFSITNTTHTRAKNARIAWPHRFEYRDFNNVKILQEDRMQIVIHPNINVSILMKTASAPLDMLSLEREVTMYQLLHGSGVTPEFLGCVTKSGQTIGFITEYIQEVPSIRRRNLPNCLSALRELHEKGIAHGDAHDGNCLIREDGSAVLIDFELSEETGSAAEFARDLKIMGRCLKAVAGAVEVEAETSDVISEQ